MWFDKEHVSYLKLETIIFLIVYAIFFISLPMVFHYDYRQYTWFAVFFGVFALTSTATCMTNIVVCIAIVIVKLFKKIFKIRR